MAASLLSSLLPPNPFVVRIAGAFWASLTSSGL